MANPDSGIDDELLKEINKKYGPKEFYLKMSSFYLDNYKCLTEIIDESGTHRL